MIKFQFLHKKGRGGKATGAAYGGGATPARGDASPCTVGAQRPSAQDAREGEAPSGVAYGGGDASPCREEGVALIAVVLLISLVVGSIVIALTNSTVGRVLTSTQLRAKTTLECGQGDLDLANQLLVMGTRDVGSLGIQVGDKPPGAQPAGVQVDMGRAGGDPDQNDFAEELVGGEEGTALGSDNVANNPDIVITTNPNCITNIDIDFLFHHRLNQAEVDEASKYHTATGGTVCEEGDFYSITALTQGAAGSGSRVRSAFYKCLN